MKKNLLLVFAMCCLFVSANFAQNSANSNEDNYIIMSLSAEKLSAQTGENVELPKEVKSQDEMLKYIMAEYPVTDMRQQLIVTDRGIIIVIKPTSK